ncbi:MAG TPA: hypothetical protein VNK45_09960 [Candidatus Acidoferrales bacterium]|nr:hypothetical protein [Candidatus Acidoferrales bacterium]
MMFFNRRSTTERARYAARRAARDHNFDAINDLFDDLEAMALDRLQSLREKVVGGMKRVQWNELRDILPDDWNRSHASRYVRAHPLQVIGVAALALWAISSMKNSS